MKVYIEGPQAELLIEYAGGMVTLETRDPAHGNVTGAVKVHRTMARELRRSLVEHMPADPKPPMVPVVAPNLVWYEVHQRAQYWKAFLGDGAELVWDPSSGWMPGLVSLNGIILGTAESLVGAEVVLANWAKKVATKVDHGT